MAASWFLGGRIKGTVSCQATPDGVLAAKLREAIGHSNDGQMKLILEDGGIPVTAGLKKKDPFADNICKFGDDECWVKDGKCNKMNCIYNVTCNGCNDVIEPEVRQELHKPGGTKVSHYIGMTSTSLHNRQLDHRLAHIRKEEDNVMYKHDKDKHDGVVQRYTAHYVTEERSLLNLVMREGIMIQHQMHGTSMNERKEKGRGTGIVRIQAAIT